MKNLEKCCKVLQKSRFGRSEVNEKISLGGNLGPNLMLSWLVRAQVGAKMDNLTLLGGLRGTKLELKGALGAAKKAPRELRCATRGFDNESRTLIPCAAHVPPCCRGRSKSVCESYAGLHAAITHCIR